MTSYRTAQVNPPHPWHAQWNHSHGCVDIYCSVKRDHDFALTPEQAKYLRACLDEALSHEGT